MSDRVHVVGAGLAGLACAVRLAGTGRAVTLYEAAGHAGGRCRSFHDARLGRRIDNGNHLLLGANRAAFAYLREIGAEDSLEAPARAVFPFLDLASGARWSLRPGDGRLPFWLFGRGRGVPGWGLADLRGLLRLALAGPGRRVADCLSPARPAYRRFWEPLTLAALNSTPEEASAALLWAVLKESFAKGGAGCRPYVARAGLSASFVDPALARLAAAGAELRFARRLSALEIDGGRVRALRFAGETLPLAAHDSVVLALPPHAVAGLLPGLPLPLRHNPIVNLHFALDRPPAGFGEAPFLGLLGGRAQWLFLCGNVASVTVSAAGDLAARPQEEIAALIWPEVARALDLPEAAMPPCRVIVERRATIAQSPAALAARPASRAPAVEALADNLFLAGDWTATGLPATIEGAILSGHKAAEALAASRRRSGASPARATGDWPATATAA